MASRLVIKNRKLRSIVGAWILLLTSFSGYAQQGYEIEVTLKGLKDTTCLLGHYNLSGNSFISKDTARADSQGRMVFKGDSLPGGIYLVVLPGNSKWAELIYSGEERRFSLVSDTVDIVGNMRVTHSLENQFYYDFRQFAEKKMHELAQISDADAKDPRIREIRNEIEQYRKTLIETHPDLLTSKFLRSVQTPEVPPAPKLPDGRDDSTWVFNYYKKHFWDSIDFNDDRLLRTPILQPKLEQYVKNLVVQTADSLIKEADELIARSNNKEFRLFLIRYFATEYENPKVVGTEAVFVHIAEKYYLSGEVALSEDGKKRISERINVLKPLLVNKVFPSLSVANEERKPVRLHELKHNYTVVFFYSPTCGHCKESVPKLLEFYHKNKALGVGVLAVATENSDEEWKKFISEQKTGELLNGYDYSGQIDFRNEYDVLSTPTIYVLDKDKRILARKLPVEQLGDFLAFHQRKMQSQ